MRIFIADTETTGLTKNDKVVEWAHIEVRLEQRDAHVQLVEVSRFECLVHPHMPIPEKLTEIHGINDAMVKNAPALYQIVPKCLNLCPNENFLLVGHNFPGYDMMFIDGLIPKHGDVGCTLKAARTFLKDEPKHSLDKLRVSLKMPATLAHSAMGDCETTLWLLNHMLTYGMPWDDMVAAMTARLETISFGKHKGKALGDLPSDYVEWVLNECDNCSWDLRRALLEL